MACIRELLFACLIVWVPLPTPHAQVRAFKRILSMHRKGGHDLQRYAVPTAVTEIHVPVFQYVAFLNESWK